MQYGSGEPEFVGVVIDVCVAKAAQLALEGVVPERAP